MQQWRFRVTPARTTQSPDAATSRKDPKLFLGSELQDDFYMAVCLAACALPEGAGGRGSVVGYESSYEGYTIARLRMSQRSLAVRLG